MPGIVTILEKGTMGGRFQWFPSSMMTMKGAAAFSADQSHIGA